MLAEPTDSPEPTWAPLVDHSMSAVELMLEVTRTLATRSSVYQPWTLASGREKVSVSGFCGSGSSVDAAVGVEHAFAHEVFAGDAEMHRAARELRGQVWTRTDHVRGVSAVVVDGLEQSGVALEWDPVPKTAKLGV